jgi:hypothetical protein
VVEWWSGGALERWSVGALERWSVGALECWSVGALEWWSDGVMEWWSVGALERWSVARTLVRKASLLYFFRSSEQNRQTFIIAENGKVLPRNAERALTGREICGLAV